MKMLCKKKISVIHNNLNFEKLINANFSENLATSMFKDVYRKMLN